MDPSVLCLGRADERLRRHTADVDARPAQCAAFRYRDAGAEIGCLNRGGETRRASPYDQEVKLAAASRDHAWRLGHWPPPGVFDVSGRMVAPKPVSLVRWAAISAGLTRRGS